MVYHNTLERNFETYERGVAAVRSDVILTHQLHSAVELGVENVNELGDAVLTEDVGEVEWSADTNGDHAERNESEYVRGVADTTVGVDFDLTKDLGVVAV